MSSRSEHEKKADQYAASRIREIRGDVSRVDFGKRIGIKENALHSLESGASRIHLGRLAVIAHCLDIPLSSFILPDDENHPPNDQAKRQHECMEAQA